MNTTELGTFWQTLQQENLHGRPVWDIVIQQKIFGRDMWEHYVVDRAL